MSLYVSPLSKYMIFRMFTCNLLFVAVAVVVVVAAVLFFLSLLGLLLCS